MRSSGVVKRSALGPSILAVCTLILSCRSETGTPVSPVRSAQAAVDPPPAPPGRVPSTASSDAPVASAASSVAEPPAATPADAGAPSFADWLRPRLPPGGVVAEGRAGSPVVKHTVAAADTALTIAKAYLDLTDVYRAKDLAAEIAKRNPTLAPGTVVEIPHLLAAPYKTPDEGRLAWPADRALRGVFITGIYAAGYWPDVLEKLAARGLNAVVLDGKDYMGTVNYPTHAKLAVETNAAKDPPIPDFYRAIRFAHDKGIRVIVRVPCFHDPWAAKYAKRVGLMSTSGHPFEMGWTDPANDEAQQYVVDLTRELIDLGADEIQLDYVRFPVYSPGIKYAAMPAADGHRSLAIRDFVRRVHDVTAPRHVPLSLDIFGVTATGSTSDIEGLGQNIGVIGGEAEALSPMVYPSHYGTGFMGFEEPGNHPEIVGMGSKAAVEKLHAAHVTTTVIRPWLQASAYKSSAFGPKYIEDEIRSAESNGSVGWLMWDPDNNYWAVWRAVHVVANPSAPPQAP